MWCSVHVWGVRDGKGMGRRLRGVEGSRYVYRVARYGCVFWSWRWRKWRLRWPHRSGEKGVWLCKAAAAVGSDHCRLRATKQPHAKKATVHHCPMSIRLPRVRAPRIEGYLDPSAPSC
jgi:hypothetical protein